jgi:hypothetical protein
MGVLLARCPVTDKKFSTGIQVQTTPKFEPAPIARTARRNTCGGPVMRSLWTSFRHPNGSKTRNKALSGSNGTLRQSSVYRSQSQPNRHVPDGTPTWRRSVGSREPRPGWGFSVTSLPGAVTGPVSLGVAHRSAPCSSASGTNRRLSGPVVWLASVGSFQPCRTALCKMSTHP